MQPLGRYLLMHVERAVSEAPLFLTGPRQVGKTTLALGLPEGRRGYLCWDVREDRARILRRELPFSSLWVLDEIHRFQHWPNLIKEMLNSRPESQRLLVTGSARLNPPEGGGDALAVRCQTLRLHPLSVAELRMTTPAEFHTLLTLGGFPEPFLGGSEEKARRWSREHQRLLIHEELASLEDVRDAGNPKRLMRHLPDRVGESCNLNSLRKALHVSHTGVSRWVMLLERIYALFRLPPFGAPGLRALKKAARHYHFDWTLPSERARRFKNLMASHLLKWAHHEQDVKGRDLNLRYFRGADGREVDFVMTEKGRAISLIQCAWDDADPDPGLLYLKSRFPPCEAWQVSGTGRKDYLSPEGIRVCPATVFLSTLV